MNTQHAIRFFTLVTLCLAALPTGSSHAATFQVYPSSAIGDRHDADPGDGVSLSSDGISTLRTAIEEANAFPGNDRIVLNITCFTPYYDQATALSLGSIIVTENLDIVSNSCDGAQEALIGWFLQSNTIQVPSGVKLLLSGLEFGFDSFEGVGFHVEEGGILEVRSLPETNNDGGIGVFRANGTISGGAVLNEGGTVILEDCFFGLNRSRKGVVANIGGTMQIRRTLFSENLADVGGGAVFADAGTTRIETSAFVRSRSSAGGAIYLKSGAMSIINSTFGLNESDNAGGAIYVEGGELNLVNVTIAENAADVGLGEGEGEGEVVSLPSGSGGLYVSPGATVRMGNTLIAKNTDANGTPDLSGTIMSLGNNFVGIVDGATGLDGSEDMTGTGIAPLDAMIAPFKSSLSFPLEAGSPAVDAGNTALLLNSPYVSETPVVDVRESVRFARLRGLSVDIGSYERQSALPVHTADQNENLDISLSEVLRVIQFFNSAGYACAEPPESTEDGFTPNPPGQQFCVPHSSDYDNLDWTINLSELLRTIQFYNSGGYTFCPNDDTEDGYCPAG